MFHESDECMWSPCIGSSVVHFCQLCFVARTATSCGIMLDTHAAEVASYLGICKTLLRFRIVRSSVHEQVNLAIDETFRYHLKLSLAATLCHWEMQFRLRFVISDVHSSLGIPIGKFISFVLKHIGCWCAETEWPWLRNRLTICLKRLTFLPEVVWRAPWQGFRLAPAYVTSLVAGLIVWTWREPATVEQMLKACIALVCDEAYIISGSDESDYGDSDQDIWIWVDVAFLLWKHTMRSFSFSMLRLFFVKKKHDGNM